ncbi:MAG: hypothetical protein QGH39_12265 [Candidatus Thermoplasmatota archaeon]|jgi:hypothetical protein|nr:hypothetical protein [Candidatus Thermoplasmatota archaeon]MDP7266320.1 hypothetical protein [Candidatus Thermoplasmatota archaeon]
MAREIPTGVIVIGILFLITGPMNMISAIFYYGAAPGMIIFQIVQAVLVIVVGICLLLCQNWARFAAIILSFISVLFGVMALALGQICAIVNIIIVLTIAVYLAANKDVIRAFSSKKDDFEDEYSYYEDYYEDPEEMEEYDEDGFADVFTDEKDKEGFTEIFPGDDDNEGFTEIIQDDEENGEGLSDSGTRKLVFRVKGG